MNALADKTPYSQGQPVDKTPDLQGGRFVVCLYRSTGNAFLGKDLQFSTLDPKQAYVFEGWEGERFRDHWRGWYRGFAGDPEIEMVPAP